MAEQPFFEPWREPEYLDEPPEETDIPWMPPAHVVGVVVPLGLDLVRDADTCLRLTSATVFRRGLSLTLASWRRPGTTRSREWPHGPNPDEPRVGLRLPDGTRVGHRSPFDHVEGREPWTWTQVSGHGGELTAERTWWLHPFPDGEELEVVVAWEGAGVPQTSTRLALAALRRAAEDEVVLWDPPPGPVDGDLGWFAYAPMSGEAFPAPGPPSPDTDPEDGEDDDRP
ncbi:hypothetical protein [Phycicoccus avicenniae]|uniref:hypothetical protein n=1 Tax=Phycicoccus avicenniae TaxID=2828860 RepID=UPI003D269B51